MLKNILLNFEWQRSADKHGPKRLAVFVVSSESTRAVIFNRVGKKLEIEESLFLPKWNPEDSESTLRAFRADYELEAHYCSVVFQDEKEQCRVLQLPKKELKKSNLRQQIYELTGMGSEQAVMFEVEESSRKDPVASIVACSLPWDFSDELRSCVETAGYKPVSLLLSSAAVLNFTRRFVVDSSNEGYSSYLYVDDLTSTFVVFKGMTAVLVRHFGIGYRNIISTICESFGFDEDMALDTFLTNSFDFSSCMNTFTAWFHQISISMDYIERQSGVALNDLNVLGFGAKSQTLCNVISKRLKRQVNVTDLRASLEEIVDGELDERFEEFVPAISEAYRIMLGGFEK